MIPICEIFDEFTSKKTHQERINVLRRHGTPTLQKIMYCIFHPTVTFFIKKLPTYKIDIGIKDPTMADYKLDFIMLNKIYLFSGQNAEMNKLPYDKREKILIQFLEGMHKREGLILLDVLFKTCSVPMLTEAVVREAWPNLLPKVAVEQVVVTGPLTKSIPVKIEAIKKDTTREAAKITIRL